MVRVSSHEIIFDKGYMPNKTMEHLTVNQAMRIKRNNKRRVYVG